MTAPSGHILTRSRRWIDPFDLRPELIDALDIAFSLASIPRFLGHTLPRPYTVAEHSVRVARTLTLRDPEDRLAALLHDAHEAYLGDVPRPIRQSLRLADGRTWENVETEAGRAVRLAFGLPADLPPATAAAIRQADDDMLALELHQLMGQNPPPSEGGPKQLVSAPWDRERAATVFLELLEAYRP